MIVLFLVIAGFSVDLAEIEMFRGCQVAEALGGYVLYDSQRLVLIDADGSPVYSYAESGEGPETLRGVKVLEGSSERLVVITHGHRILIFNNQLQVTGALPPLPEQLRNQILSGNLMDGKLRVSTHSWHEGPAILELIRDGDGWVSGQSVLRNGTEEWEFLQGKWVRGEMTLAEEGPYLLEWYEDPFASKELRHVGTEVDIEVKEKSKLFYAVVTKTARIGQKTVVSFGVLGDDGERREFLDSFGIDGQRKTRQEIKEDRLVPCTNCDDVFILENGELLMPIKEWKGARF